MDNNEGAKSNIDVKETKQKNVMNVVTLTLSIIAIVLSTFAIGSNVISNTGSRPRTMAMQNDRTGSHKKNQKNATRSFMQDNCTNSFGGFNRMRMTANRRPRQFMQNNRFNNANGRNMMQNNRQGRFKNQNNANVSPNRSFRNGNVMQNRRQNQNNENEIKNSQNQNNNRQNNVPNVVQNNDRNEMSTFPNNQ